jgi:hypothetical protein
MAINMYFDQGAGPGTQMCNNLMIGCDRGFFLEIGVGAENKLIIDNNIIMAKKYGISTRNSGGISVLHN